MTDQINQPDWVMVPREPTEAMIEAGWIDKEDVDPDDIYCAMIAAAPKPAPEPATTFATTAPDEMVALEMAARNFPGGPGARIRLAMAALNYARAAIAALTEGRGE